MPGRRNWFERTFRKYVRHIGKRVRSQSVVIAALPNALFLTKCLRVCTHPSTHVLEMMRFKKVPKSHVSRFVTAAPTRLPPQSTYPGHQGLQFAANSTCNGRLVRAWRGKRLRFARLRASVLEFPMLLQAVDATTWERTTAKRLAHKVRDV